MSNWERYEELKKTYKIKKGLYGLVPRNIKVHSVEYDDALRKALEEYDVVVESAGVGYAHNKYRVVKNAPRLSTKDLAIICDDGNLPFGYRVQGGLIYVHTD